MAHTTYPTDYTRSFTPTTSSPSSLFRIASSLVGEFKSSQEIQAFESTRLSEIIETHKLLSCGRHVTIVVIRRGVVYEMCVHAIAVCIFRINNTTEVQYLAFSEFREIYTDWVTNNCNSSEELFPNRSTSDVSLAGYEHTSDNADYYRIDTNSTRELRQVTIPDVTEDDDVTKYVHGEECAEVGADLSFESRELTYYGLSDYYDNDATDISDHYYDIIRSRQTCDEYDDHNGVADSPPPITR